MQTLVMLLSPLFLAGIVVLFAFYVYVQIDPVKQILCESRETDDVGVAVCAMATCNLIIGLPLFLPLAWAAWQVVLYGFA